MLRPRLWLAAALCVLLACCAPSPQPAHPALWRIDGPDGAKGWLFGTIHTLPAPLAWRTATVDSGLREADTLVVEIADLASGATAQTFARLAHSPGQQPLVDRVAPTQRPALAALLAKGHMNAGDFADIETWAAALTLAQLAEADTASSPHPEWGIDRALLADHGAMTVTELEGGEAQLALFDRLPESDQRRLLALVIAGSGSAADDARRLSRAWQLGDMAAIEASTRDGLLADPVLRSVLFTRRNRDWTARIDALLRQHRHPFVAVGAAHMAGPEGLPALLAARGWRVTRIE
jgi:uncharacterized protein YbaP (TraB family)